MSFDREGILYEKYSKLINRVPLVEKHIQDGRPLADIVRDVRIYIVLVDSISLIYLSWRVAGNHVVEKTSII